MWWFLDRWRSSKDGYELDIIVSRLFKSAEMNLYRNDDYLKEQTVSKLTWNVFLLIWRSSVPCEVTRARRGLTWFFVSVNILTSENLCTCCYLPILSSAFLGMSFSATFNFILFLVFHCGHYFHTACAVKELIFATNSKKTATELKTLLQELNTNSTSPVTRQKIERLGTEYRTHSYTQGC